ncbi:hypothetical protein COW36_10395 [bacterium (Candidatus Blackallbacteria) CG17_big_fil_post_rev_8_21_14_2_50_48_46]|uniref:Type II secretion system protein GspE N-terminal domain-containing protein n=1 Tax=bacterium (Candidatus Blackallbacteria) CG17_big_fil_post_rev_8_21_14_2_50_48_46 TaxID=2014261 RepID=A0A2M7G560_9BACT|nr:MAG: hypothetical protein COW64_20170 [bacterium (Candidatus Blackallbacteria) CG18_big_fil_WC_8_21_14_2_50_49_26]PIW17041.1 MAG: hypothetical protein COW36_10395 [bacterium (Candidatus Blackallbacteria) CG17_big_fil_post_rev_8_21_14_2_50_48_46]PIW47724.1 MAG: hypothetical protein COW20_11825 [bacterium (Candidatus Blackallbacteria) CG13_big_fil_rev_8_21_14_2_50_49_14]
MLPKRTESIDRILLEKGLITPEQLTSALQYQCRLPRGQEMTLAEVVVALEFVSEDEIQVALGEKPPIEDVLLQQLIKDGLIQQSQLEDALKNRESSGEEKRMGTVLLEMGYTTKEMIEAALQHYYKKQPHTSSTPSYNTPPTVNTAEQFVQPQAPQPPTSQNEEENTPLGQALIRKGYITAEELQDAIDYQFRLPRILHKPIGEILVLLGYISQSQLNETLKEQSAPASDSLGQVLVTLGIIQQWQLSHVLTLKYQPEHAHKKVGTLLVEMGYARRHEIEAGMKEYLARQQQRSN